MTPSRGGLLNRLLILVTRNLGWKLLSLCIAVLLWIAVASEPELAMFTSVPVQYRELPDELEISSNLVESVYLELRGPRGELRNFADSKRSAVVFDMSTVRPGEQTFPVGPENINLPRGLHLVRAIPSQIRFQFERRVTADVSVRVRFSEDRADGYEIAGFTVDPAELTIVGPESHVKRIHSALTDPVDLSAVVGTAEFRVNAFVDDTQVRFRSSPQVVVKVTMKKK